MPERDSICVVTHPLGGAGETATQSLLNILTAITSVSLIVPGLAESSDLHSRGDLNTVVDVSVGEPADSIPVAAIQFLLHQLRLSVAIARRDESMVLFYGATAYLLPIFTAKLLCRTVILEPRGDVPLTLRLHWEQRIPSPLARLLAGSVRLLEWIGYWLADAIITYTPSMADELGVDRFSEKVYPNGARYVDTDEFYPRVPYEERNQIVGFIGRLDEEKNVRMLAEAAKELPPEIIFRFVGDGELREELETELTSEIERGQVEFTGWVDHEEIPRELTEMRLLVLPSEPTEGLPTVILEAMACGTPVLATSVSGVPDVVRTGETGFILDDNDRDEIRTAIEQSVRRAVDANMNQACSDLIEREYSFTAAVQRYRTILTEIQSSSTA